MMLMTRRISPLQIQGVRRVFNHMQHNSKKKILIIEDEPAILYALALVFADAGFDVSTAGDGEEGLRSALTIRPDIIILDIIMPKMDGMEMMKRIRQEGEEWGESVKVIVYTNLSYMEKRYEAARVGIHDFLVKANVPLDDVVMETKRILEPPRART